MVPDPQQQLTPAAVRALHCILSRRALRLKVQCLTRVLFLVHDHLTPHPLVQYCWGPFRKMYFKNNEDFKNMERNPIKSSLKSNTNFWNKSLLRQEKESPESIQLNCGLFRSFVTRKMTKWHKTTRKKDWQNSPR